MEMTTEKIYDNEIAPKLLEISKICETHKIPFLAVVEWAAGKIGSTSLQTPNEGLEMTMIRHCAKTAPNIDGYYFGLSRYANEKNIDTSNSIVMNLLNNR